MEKITVGLTEHVIFKRGEMTKGVIARIDTGATLSSVDAKLAAELKLGPVTETKTVRSAHGTKLRPVITAEFILGGRTFRESFTLIDREHMKYKVLIGQNILKKGFLIDPCKKE